MWSFVLRGFHTSTLPSHDNLDHFVRVMIVTLPSRLQDPFTLLGIAVIGWLLFEAASCLCLSPELLRRRAYQSTHPAWMPKSGNDSPFRQALFEK